MKFLITTLIFFFTIENSLCQLNRELNSKPFIINYPKEEYKADNQNWSITTDNKGIIYIANNKCLLEFDGSNWFQYDMPDGNIVRSVLVDDKNRVFVGSYEQFGFWESNIAGEKKYISLSDSLKKEAFHNDEIWRIVAFNHNIYFQSFSTIYKFDGKKIKIIKPESSVVLLLKARNRLFIHLIGRGFCELKDDKLILLPGSEFLANDEVKFILPFDENSFLIGATNNGLLIYNGQHFTKWDIPYAEKIKNSEINNGVFLGHTYAIGTITDGIFILDKNGAVKHHLNTTDFLQNNTVLALHADCKKNLWVALDRGIDYIEMNSLLDFYIDPYYTIGTVYTAALDGENLWIGTNKGLYKYTFNKIQNIYTNPQMIPGSQGQVWCLKRIGKDLLCGHTNGTYIVNNDKIKKICDVNGGYDFEKISINGSEFLVQSTYSTLVVYKKTIAGWEYSHIVDGFVEPIPDIELDHMGNIWAAHLKKGIFKLELNDEYNKVRKIRYYGKNEGFKNEKSIQVSKLENRVVFTNGGPIYTYDDLNDTIIIYDKIFKKHKKLFDVKRIIPVNDNNYWFIKSNCLSMYYIEDDDVTLIFNYDLFRQQLFMTSDNPGIVSLSNELQLICLDNGFALFDINKINALPGENKIQLRKVVAISKDKDQMRLPLEILNGYPKLPFLFRNLQFTFASSEISVNNIYRYQLKGLNNNFSEWTSGSVIEFERLPYNTYEFIVESKDIYGATIASLNYSFEVKPPFYATKIALIIYTLILIIILIFFRLIFKKRLKQHKEKIMQEEAEKREKELMASKQEFMKLKNENLKNEIYYKNVQLANYAMTISNKNDLLMNIKDNIKKQRKELGDKIPGVYFKKQIHLLNRHISTEDEWKTFEGYFDQIHQDFFKRIISEYPDLTQSDLRLCAYLRLNLSSKEIAPLLNISLRGVEARRYRLRKRLNFEHDKNLVEFLLKF